jgi:hypothetical protein
MVATVDVLTGLSLTENVAEVEPWATVTLEGTVTAVPPFEVSETSTPPEGAV